METNWAGNYTYQAARIASPSTVAELQELVATSERIRALGSRHTFTEIADTAGTLVSLAGIPRVCDIDEEARTVTVDGGVRYGDLARELHARGWALSNLASLPHISVAGAVATGTHGSGVRNQSLASSVRGIRSVGPDGELAAATDVFAETIAIGALGIVTELTLEIEPTYDVAQAAYPGMTWDSLESHFDEIVGSAYSVSFFTHWADGIDLVWLKSRTQVPDEFFGSARSPQPVHMLGPDADASACTDQSGVPGPWHERLPHFRMEFTPSNGAELQSEYYVSRADALAAIRAIRSVSNALASVMQVAEIRTIAAENHWLSGSFEQDAVGFHFTWIRDTPTVYEVLAQLEAALAPYGARPHWGKCFIPNASVLHEVYSRLGDFARLRSTRDPQGKFSNRMLDLVLGIPAQ